MDDDRKSLETQGGESNWKLKLLPPSSWWEWVFFVFTSSWDKSTIGTQSVFLIVSWGNSVNHTKRLSSPSLLEQGERLMLWRIASCNFNDNL